MDLHEEEKLLEGLFLELRRGTIIISVLSQLRTPKYGYSLVILLEEKGIQIDAGTLYPLLRRLEKQELLTSYWDTDGTKPRKYYAMSVFGKEIYEKLCKQWIDMAEMMSNFINDKDV